MADKRFNFFDFLIRWILALLLVFATYNPSGYSWFDWIFDKESTIGPIVVLAGLVLLIGWIIYLRATSRSLGILGVVLASAVFGVIIWLLVDLGVLGFDGGVAMQWVVLTGLATIMAVGMSWSHIRRLMTGQYDIDDIDEG